MQEIIWSEQSSLPLLSLLLWLPALVLLGLLWTRDGARARRLALAGAAGELALAISLLVRFERGTPALQFVEYWGGRGGWPAYHLGVDGLSILFLPLTALLVLLLVGYIGLQPDGARRRKALIMVAGYESLLVGLFVSLDGLLFWMFAAAELLAAALLVGGLGTTRNRARAALHAGQFLGIGVVLLLSALVMLAWGHGQGESAWTFNMVAWRGADLSMLRQELVLGLLLIALAIRLPAFPFHVWLPTVAREGPVAIAVVLLGGMQVAVYALLRIGPVLPIAMHDYAWPVTWIALAGVLYAAVLAFMQLNLRSLLAFAVVSQNGAMLVALFSLTQSGFEGGLLLALNYGLALAGLLLIVGLMHRRAGTALLPRLAGKFDQAPLIGLFFLAAALGRIAMPGTPGFEAAHLALEGTLESRGWTITMLAGLSNVLAAGYLFWAYQRIFLVRTPKSKRLVPDLDVHERIVVGMLCAVMFGVGLYATPWIETITASTRELAAHVAQAPADIVVGRLDTGVVRE